MHPNHQDRFRKLHWSFYRICKLVTGPDVVGADVVDADADFVNVDFVDADVGANLVDAEVVCADVVGAEVGADAVRTDVVIGADVFGAEKSNWYRDCAAYFEVGGGANLGGGVVTASHENVVFLATNNASREAKCVKTCQFIPII